MKPRPVNGMPESPPTSQPGDTPRKSDGNYWTGRRVCVTGGRGFLGTVLCRQLHAAGCDAIVVPERGEYDLTQSEAVEWLLTHHRPDIIFHLAAEVGGIGANRRQPGRFFYANLAMGLNLIEAVRRHGVEKFVQIGTVCSYPKHCPVPFREDDLWNGYPEETNAPYGVAKKALLVMMQAYRQQYGLKGVYLLPVNLYGPGDNFDPETSHVIPALIRKFREAKLKGRTSATCWGTGRASREFLYVEDAAEAVLLAAERLEECEPINIGTGREITIRDLAGKIAELSGYEGEVVWDATRPDGQPRRQLDVTRATNLLNWQAKTDLETGLKRSIEWWTNHHVAAHTQSASACL
jgi:GDP-L-fucose synthase